MEEDGEGELPDYDEYWENPRRNEDDIRQGTLREVEEDFRDMMEDFRDDMGDFFDGIGDFFGDIWGAIRDFFNDLFTRDLQCPWDDFNGNQIEERNGEIRCQYVYLPYCGLEGDNWWESLDIIVCSNCTEQDIEYQEEELDRKLNAYIDQYELQELRSLLYSLISVEDVPVFLGEDVVFEHFSSILVSYLLSELNITITSDERAWLVAHPPVIQVLLMEAEDIQAVGQGQTSTEAIRELIALGGSLELNSSEAVFLVENSIILDFVTIHSLNDDEVTQIIAEASSSEDGTPIDRIWNELFLIICQRAGNGNPNWLDEVFAEYSGEWPPSIFSTTNPIQASAFSFGFVNPNINQNNAADGDDQAMVLLNLMVRVSFNGQNQLPLYFPQLKIVGDYRNNFQSLNISLAQAINQAIPATENIFIIMRESRRLYT